MERFLMITALGIYSAVAAPHSLLYLHTATSGLPGFPEFVTVVTVDGQPLSYYDSVVRREIPRQSWSRTEDLEVLETRPRSTVGDERVFSSHLEKMKLYLNQSGGVNIVQSMYGCEWDDKTGEVKGQWQFGYNGEDIVVFDLKRQTWRALTPEAVFTKRRRGKDKNWVRLMDDYLSRGCPEQLKKYVTAGKSFLMRTALPSVSFLQKNLFTPVSCHATGFYPDRADLFWRRDGEEIYEGVDKGEILPNNDGTFQMSVELKLSSDDPEEMKRYECVFRLDGVGKEIVRKLERSGIQNNGPSRYEVTVSVVVAMIVLAAVVADWLILYNQRKGYYRNAGALL